MFGLEEKGKSKESCPRRMETSVIDAPIQSASDKKSGGGKKSRPQYPLRHSRHGRLDSKMKMEFCYTSGIPPTKDKSNTMHRVQNARGHQRPEEE